jgi:phosphatidate cytidylyltransferase
MMQGRGPAAGDPAPARAPEAPQAPRRSDLRLRVISALVLVPVAVAAAWFGGWAFAAFWGIAAVLILWEWLALAGARTARVALGLGGVAIVAATVLAGAGRADLACAAALVGVVAAALVGPGASRAWVGGGVLYASALAIAVVLLRADAAMGLLAIIFLFAVVWATDILAYFVGRAVGGPKLWPAVSPKKTWSGAAGGTVAAIVLGVAVVWLGGAGRLAPVAGVALVLSVISQFGDLMESAIKRHFGVKDASQLIPGHGGLMDRLDGFITAVVAAAAFGVLRGGADGAARGLLAW